jgi:hypothetical protein
MLTNRSDFLILFPNCTGSSLYVTPQLLKGNAEGTNIHSAIWKFYLVVRPCCRDGLARADDWVHILKEKRESFHRLKAQHFIKPPDDDADPLAAGDRADPRWRQYFSDQQLRATIARDVSRAFQEIDYFQSAEIMTTLEDILFLFCRTHPRYEYAQGLHELAAFILYRFFQEMKAEDRDTLSFIFNTKAVIPDCYWTFSALAEHLERIYQASTDGDSPCSQMATEVQTTLLAQQSADLARVLAQAEIAPQTYMVQWIRLLFVRVFDLKDAVDAWDIIIAHLPNLDVIKNTCLAMLLHWRSDLIAMDSTSIFSFLFKFPKNVPGVEYVRRAVDLSQTRPKRTSVDVSMMVAERLNELARGLEAVCLGNHIDEAVPYIMDMRRVRDVLMGTLDIDEMLPLEQAVELFKPATIEMTIAREETEDKAEKPEVAVLPKAGRVKSAGTPGLGGLFDELPEPARAAKKRKEAPKKKEAAKPSGKVVPSLLDLFS